MGAGGFWGGEKRTCNEGKFEPPGLAARRSREVVGWWGRVIGCDRMIFGVDVRVSRFYEPASVMGYKQQCGSGIW